MDKFYNDDLFEKDISIEEFDHITDGVEDHVFSDRYLAGKEKMMKAYTQKKKAKMTGIFPKVAVAAATVLVIGTPFAVNAATNGAFFASLWGTEGKTNIPNHTVKIVESDKIGEDGKPVTHTFDMPKVEFADMDPEKAAALLKGKLATNPVVAECGGYKFTVLAVARDRNGIAVEYTIENPDGVKLLNYSQHDNEAKGAWTNEDQTVRYDFGAGPGKTYVDISKSTSTKLYCRDYMTDVDFLSKYADKNHADFPTDAGMKLNIVEYNDTMTNLYKAEKDPNANIKNQVTVDVPFAEAIEMNTFTSADNDSVKISPISMKLTGSAKLYGKNNYGDAYNAEFCEGIDFLKSAKITYNDGSDYTVYISGDENGKGAVANYAYIVGEKESICILFNRLVDTNNISKITINGIEFNVK